ncbi:MAG: DDE-type integrase/transposase/recombinase [Acidimicrobiales bacterium]
MIDAAFAKIEAIAGTRAACAAVGRPRASHYRRGQPPRLGPPAPRPTPPNALSASEAQAVLAVLHSERFADAAPAQVWATLLDEGAYLASESTMYRLLRNDGEVTERRRQATHPPRAVPELLATRPNEVWSYDATALKGPVRGSHYDLLVMIDIFSRYVPGWAVVDIHDGPIVKAWIDQVVAAQGGIEAGTLAIHSVH